MIHHIFPGNLVLHVPYMIDILVRHAHEIGVAEDEQIFYLYKTTDRHRINYDHIGLPADRLKFRKGRKLDASLWSNLKKNDIIIFHSAFFEGMWFSLLLRPRIWENTAVLHWGGDVANYYRQKHHLMRQAINSLNNDVKRNLHRLQPRDKIVRPHRKLAGKLKRMLYGLIEPRLRSIILSRLGVIGTGTPGEFNIINEMHGPCDNYMPMVFYTNTSDLTPSSRTKPGNKLGILLGNSGWGSNNHIEVLSWLSQFKNENIQVICPLGYPPPSPYIYEVIETGKRLLGDKFTPLLDVIPKSEYNDLLATIDVFILNAKRQQGLYNVYASLLNGKKVYLSPDSPTYGMLREWGTKVFDVRHIASSSFHEFSSFSPEDAEKNHEIGQQHFSLQATLRSFNSLIIRMRNGKGTQ